VVAATESYRAEQDLIAAFIDECCVTSDDRTTASPIHVEGGALYTAYVRWCERNHEEPLSQRAFGDRLSERAFAREKQGRYRRWHRFGIGLREA
jgi:putative DNA primase/helicase